MVSMFPASSRVKLNRVALKDVIGLQLVPRRRRVQQSPENEKRVEKHEGPSVEDPTAVMGRNEPVCCVSTDNWRPGSATEVASCCTAEEEPEHRRVGTLKARGRHCGQSRRQGDNMEVKQQRAGRRDTPRTRAGSEVSLRRPAASSRCLLCGDCRYKSPQNETLGKQRQKCSSPGPEQSKTQLKIKKEIPETENSKKIIVWIDQYPKVGLCDVAQKCDVCSHGCSYLLPDVLKTKVVHCFKREIRDGFLFRPACSGHNEHHSKDSVLANVSKSDASTRQSRSATKHLRKHRGSGISSHSTYRFVKGWTSEASAVFPMSLLSKQENKAGHRMSMWDRDAEEKPGPGCDLIGADLHRDKRMKLGDNIKDGSVPPSQHLTSVNCDEVANINKSCSGMPGGRQPGLERTFGSCSTSRPAVKEGCVLEEPDGRMCQPRETDAAQTPSELLCERNQVGADELESFTCQRVRVYCKKIKSSCARTYMPWPFSSNSSRALAAHAGNTASPTEPVQPSARYSDSLMNQSQSSSPSSQTKGVLSSATATNQVPDQNKDKQERECVITKGNRERDACLSSHSSDVRKTEFTDHLVDAEPSLVTSTSSSSAYVNMPENDSSMSTPSPSALGLSDWETVAAFSPMPSLLTDRGSGSLPATPTSNTPSLFRFEKVKCVQLAEGQSARSPPASSPRSCCIKAVETPQFHCEETQMAFRGSSPRPSSITNNSDSFASSESLLLLPQDEQDSDKDFFIERSPPVLEPYFRTSPLNGGRPVAESPYGTKEQCEDSNSSEFMLPPLLSPVTTPHRHNKVFGFTPQSQSSSDEAAIKTINKHASKLQTLPEYFMPQIGNATHQKCEESPEHSQCEKSKLKSPLSQSSIGDGEINAMEEESQDESDCEDDLKQGNRSSELVPLAPQIKSSRTSGVTGPSSSPSGDEEQPCSTRDEESSSSETGDSESDKTKAEAAGDAQSGLLDEFTAYEQDILLLNVVHDDRELFENIPKGTLIKLGPTRVSDAPKARPTAGVKMASPRTSGASPGVKQRLTPVIVDFRCDSPNITEESESRSWRPQNSSTASKMPNNTRPATDKQTRTMGQADANNNHVNGGMERNQPIQTVNNMHNILPLMAIRNVSRITGPANVTDFRRQKSNSYCRQYFSESSSCGFKMCRFQHVPVEGDEKFCVETIMRFIKNPMCLQKAKTVFTAYYQNNPPGVYFSAPVFLTFLWALLKAGLVSDIFSVLSVSLAHKIVPNYEFLLALFTFVREKGLTGSTPELMQLTFKMASAGLSLDSLDCVKNTPEFQQVASPTSPGSQRLTSSTPESLILAHSMVEIELCAKQEDWRTMGKVFRSICHTSHHPNQLEQISGSIAIALLSESKDKLSVPFAAFAETVCQNEDDDNLPQSFFGRIGVSLMLRYHKTRQWDKGRKVVEVLSSSKVNYTTLKGLFGNEDSASRCCLITLATEFFLWTNSVEGALHTLRENSWFLSSSSWPCEPEDLQSRSCVLRILAGKTSHRDTLDVLRNLPGIKEPNDLIDISTYSPLFNSHLKLCVDRQTLPVASDTVAFMLSKKLSVDDTVLRTLLHKLGKQNLWLRAREVFRDSLSAGYYTDVSAPPGVMALVVPWQLEEVELALTFEMFITVNAAAILQLAEATAACLSITLKRTESGESEYLSAGSRLLSAACIPQPKLVVRYTAVNSSQEQVFTLDISSARRWLRHNHLWASEMWKH